MTTPFSRALGGELERAAERLPGMRRRRRTRVVSALAGVLVVLAGLGVVIIHDPAPASASVLVTHHDGLVALRLVDLEHSPDRIRRAAARAHIDVRVRAVPAPASLVGRFIGSLQSGPEVRRLDETATSFAGFEVPEGWSGTLVLAVGRPAATNESYATTLPATTKGEALGCLDLVGRRVSEVRSSILARDADVRWRLISGASPRQLTVAEVPGDALVQSAEATSNKEVVIQVATADAPQVPVRHDLERAGCD